jgi:hypothetical protein
MRIRGRKFSQVAVYGLAAGGGVVTTTWNPADKNANVTLSNGNLTATDTSGTSPVRAIASHSTGKFYYSVHLDALAGNGTTGIANSAATLGNFVGSDNNGVAYNPSGGSVLANSAALATIQTSVQGNTVDVAVDIGGQLIWFRTNGGNWNNSGTANPATGTGGISFASVAAGPYFPAWAGFAASDAVTANFGAAAYTFAAPAGFGNW